MANIQKLTYPYFTDGSTQLNAQNLNPIISKINEMIEAINSGVTPTPTQTVATPTISISGTTATISCSTSGATIYYTTNGNTPTTSSTQYSSPITLSGACTIKAIAVKSGMNNSSVASKSYTPGSINAPRIDIEGTAIIMSADDGATIKYTTDGTTPTSSNGTTYTHAFSESANKTVKAIAILNGNSSSVVTKNYTAPSEEATKPTVVIENGKLIITGYPSDVLLYTLDDTLPSDGSATVYTEPVTLSGACVIRVRAKKSSATVYSYQVMLNYTGSEVLVATIPEADRIDRARVLRNGSTDSVLKLNTSQYAFLRFYPIVSGEKYTMRHKQSTVGNAYYGYIQQIPQEVTGEMEVSGKLPTQDASQNDARTITIDSAENFPYVVTCNGEESDASVMFIHVIK